MRFTQSISFGMCFVLFTIAILIDPSQAQIQVDSPELIPGSINAFGDNVDPFLTADGKRLYFVSNRSGSLGLTDIWYADRLSTSDPWSAALRLDAPFNSTIAERGPFVSASELELFFHRGTTQGINDSLDLWVARRTSADDAWGDPVPLDEVNTSYADGWPILSNSGLSLYFTSVRPGDSPSSGSTYVAKRTSPSEPFGPFWPVGTIV